MEQTIKTWWTAIRPRTLTAAFIPILVATALVKASGYSVQWLVSLYALMFAFCIQIATNLINDVLDFKKGADNADRLGPPRVTQAGWLTPNQVMIGASIFLLLAATFSLPLLSIGGALMGWVALLSLVCAYLYTGGPYPLAYVGLGDLFVLIFFGWVATLAVFYLQTQWLSPSAFLAGTQIGLLAVSMIAINNLRDIDSDGFVGKRTLAVRLGRYAASYQIAFCTIAPFSLGLIWLAMGEMLAGILPLVLLPFALKLANQVAKTKPSKEYNRLLCRASFLHLGFGILLSIGLWINFSTLLIA
ncbi:MAG: 1,4-dihydroxy-2-naphthoate octaprenyltransferase [Waddliaceae bacterium]